MSISRPWVVGLLLITYVAGVSAPHARSQSPALTNDDSILQLLAEGRVDAAAAQIGFDESRGDALVSRAEELEKNGQSAKALAYYSAYLDLFPFGNLRPQQYPIAEWSRVAIAYVTLAEKLGRLDTERLKQSRDALKTYEELSRAYRISDQEAYTRFADEILAKYQGSIFTQVAMLIAARGYGPHLEDRLRRMVKAGISEKDRLLVSLALREQGTRYSTSEKGETRSANFVDIPRLTKNVYLRRAYFREQLDSQLGDQDRPAARVICLSYLDEFPGEAKHAAFTYIVDAFLKARLADDARGWIEEATKAGVSSSRTVELRLALARHHADEKHWDAAIRQFQQIVECMPRDLAMSNAMFGLAEGYGARGDCGDDDKRVAVLKDIAEFDPIESYRFFIHDYSRNRAYRELAGHYMDKRDWKEALAWWTKWHPMNRCGTGEEVMLLRLKNIEACRKMLKQP